MPKKLFSRYTVAGLTLPNRIVMAPMNRNRATDTDLAPTAMTAHYYAQRASAGLIVAEGTPVSPQARGCARTPGIYNQAQIDGWRRVTRAVHRGGGRIYLQLWHVGRVGHGALRADGSPPVGPSTARLEKDRVPILNDRNEPILAPCDPPRALETDEVQTVVVDFACAARNAIAAGFDGVEIHAANGYLFDQFRCPYLNDRTDDYGGRLENRWRLLLETVAAVADTIGGTRVGVRLSPLGTAHEMRPDPDPLSTFGYLARALDRLGIVYLHLYDQSESWIHDRQSRPAAAPAGLLPLHDDPVRRFRRPSRGSGAASGPRRHGRLWQALHLQPRSLTAATPRRTARTLGFEDDLQGRSQGLHGLPDARRGHGRGPIPSRRSRVLRLPLRAPGFRSRRRAGVAISDGVPME